MYHQIVCKFYIGVIFGYLFVGVNAQNETNTTKLSVEEKFITPCQTPDHQNGYCQEIRSCSIFLKLIANATEELKDYMRKSRCGTKNEGDPIRVCCGTKVPTFKVRPIVQEEIHENLQEQSTANLVNSPQQLPFAEDPFPIECGKQDIPIRNRIFGGMHAQLGEFPWLGRIRHRTARGEENYGCTGFLIHKKFLLTAAHCVNTMAIAAIGPIFQIVLGEHDSSKDRDCVTNARKTICADPPAVIDLKSRKTIIHPKYKDDGSDASHYFDIAIIQLKKATNFTSYIQPICLSDHSSDNTEMYLGGWGKTEKASYSNIKLKVDVPRSNHAECRRKYLSMGVNINNSQICAGGVNGKDSCNGDSGGPLMVYDKDRWFAEGVVSFGTGCGLEGWPGVYTNIPFYLNWIKKEVHDRLEEDKVQARLRRVKGRKRST